MPNENEHKEFTDSASEEYEYPKTLVCPCCKTDGKNFGKADGGKQTYYHGKNPTPHRRYVCYTCGVVFDAPMVKMGKT